MAISLTSTLLSKASFRHGFSTREIDFLRARGGADSALDRLAKESGIDPKSTRQGRQVHGTTVLAADSVGADVMAADYETWPAGDALVSSSKFSVGVRVADCVPILIADTKTGAVAAVHAGWRGFVSGIVESALQTLDGDPKSLVVAIGPHIEACCFEVGEEVVVQFERYVQSSAFTVRSSSNPEAKPRLDLRAAVRHALGRCGIEAIDDVPGCTVCDASQFFSYRREGEASGRHLALIAPSV